MNKTITIEGYLTQSKLASALKTILGDQWIREEDPVMVHGSRCRWDMSFNDKNGKVVVEFDGDKHYSDSLRIRADHEKDKEAAAIGCRVVRIPYWVQLTTETLKYYLDIDCQVIQDFPHGFITTKVFPASFSHLGFDRFLNELSKLPSTVKEDVLKSLTERSHQFGALYVLPVAYHDSLLIKDGPVVQQKENRIVPKYIPFKGLTEEQWLAQSEAIRVMAQYSYESIKNNYPFAMSEIMKYSVKDNEDISEETYLEVRAYVRFPKYQRDIFRAVHHFKGKRSPQFRYCNVG